MLEDTHKSKKQIFTKFIIGPISPFHIYFVKIQRIYVAKSLACKKHSGFFLFCWNKRKFFIFKCEKAKSPAKTGDFMYFGWRQPERTCSWLNKKVCHEVTHRKMHHSICDQTNLHKNAIKGIMRRACIFTIN